MNIPTFHIERLRVQNSDENPVALKLGLQQSLRQVRLRPDRLPPQTILVIRHLQSRPAFGLKASQLYRWQQEVQAQIEELAHRALRPGRHYIPPNAGSVLFEDEVELLVCYSRDTLAGRTAWYWANLFPDTAYPGQPTGRRLLTGWEAYPQAIPHVLVELKPQEARSALTALTQSQLSRLAHLLHRTFALPGDIFEAAVPESIPANGTGPHPFHQESLAPQAAVPFSNRPAAPWHDWLPPLLYQHLSPQAEYILGLSHTLVHRRQQAGQRPFARQSKAWLEQTAFLQPLPEQARPLSDPAARPSLPQPAEPAAPGFDGPETAGSQTGLFNQEGIYTSLGGVFFLINLLTTLKLPAAIPALEELNPWELLGALAADLLGERFDYYGADPLWSIIGELAGLEAGEQWGWSLLAAADSHQIGDFYKEAGISGPAPWSPDWSERPARSNPFTASHLSRTAARLRPLLIHFLAHLTGDPALSIESILHQPAVLYLSRTHVDLRLSLEQISIPLRRAGLDRTPGWLPEFGYIVSVYFE
jgi:hypothetical protein